MIPCAAGRFRRDFLDRPRLASLNKQTLMKPPGVAHGPYTSFYGYLSSIPGEFRIL